MSARTNLVSSIPTERVSVKSAMWELLHGLPIRVKEYSASLKPTISASEFSLASSRLLGVQREVIVRARFQLGDLWLQWQGDEFREQRRVWNAELRQRIPGEEERAKYLRVYYECAGVSCRWPDPRRSDRHGWTYYLKHEIVDGEVVERGRLAPSVPPGRVVSRLIRDDGEYVECLSAADKPFLFRMPASVPVRDERTVKP